MVSQGLFKKIFLLLGDLCFFFISLWLTLLLRHGHNYSGDIFQTHLHLFSLLAIIWLIIFYAFNLYYLNYYQHLTIFLNTFLKAMAINGILTVIFFYLFSINANITPKTVIVIQILIFSVLFSLWRYLFQKIFNQNSLKQQVLLYGLHPHLNSIIEEIQHQQHLFYLVGCYVFTRDPNIRISAPIYSLDYNLEELIKKEKITTIVIAENLNSTDSEDLAKLLPYQVDIFSLPKFYETFFQKIPIQFLETSWFLENFSEGQKRLLATPKRILDISLSLFCSIPSLLILPLLALLIKITSPGPVFFKQIRSGQNNKPFLAIKFRTMTIDAEKNGPQWAQKNDPRVTTIGKYLRKLRLDEIPQLWNILKGEMSFVGPRPERPEFIEQIDKNIAFYGYRHLVKPGLTGWAQINYPYGSSLDDARIKLEYDLYYIKNRSFFLDLSIIIKTINTVLKGWG
ncbi:MAG: sugar transferase [Candidatus Komeilibacteria bacterium]|nr:sugar transferase [Candidatus Komeilibacteria bacterium]